MLYLSYLIPVLWFGDTAAAYLLGFQDPATTTMEGIYLFNLHLLFVIISIVIVVGLLLFSVFTNFTEFDHSEVDTFVHSNPVETIENTPQNQDLQVGNGDNGNTETENTIVHYYLSDKIVFKSLSVRKGISFYSLYDYDSSIELLG